MTIDVQAAQPRRAQLSGAWFFYGDRPVDITRSLREHSPKWADEHLTPRDVEDALAKLCRNLAHLLSNTLAPADFYRRGELKVANDPRFADVDLSQVPPEAKMPRLVFFGNGFNATWKLLHS